MTDSIARLHDAVKALKKGDPALSRTARLLQGGRSKVAKKLGEEAVEVIIDAIRGDKTAVVQESADLLYNLVAVWVSVGVNPDAVWEEMKRREQLFGIAEKLPKDHSPPSPRRKIVALEAGRAHKRR